MKNYVFYLISMLLLIGGIFGTGRLQLRPDPPFQWTYHEGQVEITFVEEQVSPGVIHPKPGDVLLAIDSIQIQDPRDVQYLIDRHRSGEQLTVVTKRGAEQYNFLLRLFPRYNIRFLIINTTLGLLFWIIGIFVYFRKSSEKAARMFAWASILIGVAILAYWEGSPSNQTTGGYVQSLIFFMCNALYPAFVVAFTWLYPSKKRIIGSHPSLFAGTFLPGVFIFISLEVSYLLVVASDSLLHYGNFVTIFNIFRVMVILGLLLGIGNLLHSYVREKSREHRKKLQWIFLGISVGTAPFIFLWNVPHIFGLPPLISEEMTYLLMWVTPLCVAVSIVKYQGLDIEVVINRGLVYLGVTGLIVLIYLGGLALSGAILQNVNPRASHVISISGMLVVAMLFTPLKNRVQLLVDKTFYRVKYDYRLTMQDFSQALQGVQEQSEVLAVLHKKIQSAIPLEKCTILFQTSPDGQFRVFAGSHLSDEALYECRKRVTTVLDQSAGTDDTMLIKPGSMETSDANVLPEIPLLNDLEIELLVPVRLHDDCRGFILLGKKLAQTKFSEADIEIIRALVEESLLVLERLRFREAMILERAEKKRLAELNQLKSDFLSHVSHDLRTPLTAIKWYVQNMLDGIPEQPSPQMQAYLEGIYERSNHLYGMIEKLLDVTRIEAGKIKLQLEILDVREELDYLIETVRPFAEEKGINICLDIHIPLRLRADRGYFHEIVINLLDNAIKYSPEEGEVIVGASPSPVSHNHYINDEMVSVFVADSGPGIPEAFSEIIFNRFERQTESLELAPGGLGLGLYITKKLVELHGGQIKVETSPDQGSVFTFTLPASDGNTTRTYKI